MNKDTLARAIGLVVLIILAISQIVQLQSANRDRAELRAQTSALRAQVEALGGDPAEKPPAPGDVIIIDGEPGPKGERGERGPRGEKGDDGPEGDDGTPGEDGADGVDGVDGADGVNGVDGEPGPAGPAGPEGPAGASGPQGPTGPAGYPSSWTFTYVGRGNQTHTVTCSDPDGDRNYSCQEA